MRNIFEKLDILLESFSNELSSENVTAEKAEKIIKSIPISPEMETEEQGKKKALEKIVKYFYNLSMGGLSSSRLSRNDDIDLPDDWLDPHMKGKMSGKLKDTEFDKNKVIWDQDSEMEKLKKDIDLNLTDSDDEFDDFDYRDNDFGDDPDMDDVDTDDLDSSGGGSGDDSDKSEDEKLRDEINDALDELSDNGLDGDESEQQGGQQQSGGQQSSQSRGRQKGGQQSIKQNGTEQDSNDDMSGKNVTKNSLSTTKKDQKLKELKDAIDNGSIDGVSKSVEDIKEGDDGSGELAGERIDEVSDKDIQGDMSKAGISQKDIEEMSKMSKEDKMSDLGEEKTREMKKQVIDGLEKKCEKKGGSALAKTIVKNALKSKLNDDEWREMLKLFLKSKSVNNGDMSKTKNGTKYGHKNHMWRDAVLPTKTTSRGQIQTIYCFVDFSGSVNQDLVYVFLGRVIDLCAELNYTNIKVYGFGDKIVLPREINGRMIKKDGKDVVLAQTWDFIAKQYPGPSTENFRDVAEEIMEIRKKQRDAVYLIFGDALWGDPTNGPMCLKTICGERLLDRMCILTYYNPDSDWIEMYKGYISMLKELVGLKNVICTKAKHITEK